MDPYYRMKLCRICFKAKDVLKEIFSVDNDAQKLIIGAFADLLDDKVSTTDLLPQNVCHECLEMLISFKFFKENSIRCRQAFQAELRNPKNWTSVSTNLFKIIGQMQEETTENAVDTTENSNEVDARPTEDLVSEGAVQSDVSIPAKENDTEKHIPDNAEVANFDDDNDNNGRTDGSDDDSGSSTSHSEDEDEGQTDKTKAFYTFKTSLNEDGLFQCRMCPKAFKYRNILNAHYREHEALMPYNCPYCDRRFMDLSLLNSHVVMHSDYRPYECEICGLRLRSKTSVIAHKRCHNMNADSFLCWHCGNSYSSRNQFSRHVMLAHSGIKPFCCLECNKEFRSSDRYKKHMNSHKGIKNFLCQLCGKKFALKRKLEDHTVSVHSNEKRSEVCSICGKQFALQKYLSYHIRMVHEKIGVPRKRNKVPKTV